MPLLRPVLRLPVWLRIGLPLALVAGGWLVATQAKKAEAFAASQFPLARTPRYHPLLPAQDPLGLDPAALDATPVALPFESGDTMGEILDGLGVSGAEAGELLAELAEHADLRRLRPRDQYAARVDGERLVGFELHLAGNGVVTAERRAGGWEGSWREYRRTVRRHVVSGVLEGSLEGSLERTGGDASLSILMSEVLQWDLDFTRDLRLGDRFHVAYETVYLDGAYDSLGEILGLVYENDGRELEAYRFGGDDRYYDTEGRPLKKMFLRSPLRYSRVTSRFSNRRFHPVLKTYRPHHGVDYGAPRGTPVRVTASGRVSFAGWDRGGGKTVKVRHPNGYRTAYLHLSGFARGISPGRRVSQGDVVGYVGSTGLATGSHLDYRVQRNGRWINPLSLKSVPAEPLPESRLAEFSEWRKAVRRSLFEGASLEFLRAETRSVEGVGEPAESPPSTVVGD